jgi:hypothetical protein
MDHMLRVSVNLYQAKFLKWTSLASIYGTVYHQILRYQDENLK